MKETALPLRKIKSFVRRDGRLTDGQERALSELAPHFCLALTAGKIDFAEIFKRHAQTILEIGFGSGHSLAAMAKAHPDENYIGIETHLPGVGTLLGSIEREQLSNLRIYHADAVEVLNQCIPDASLDVIQLFFPDPWQKRKHHKRRLIQPEFVQDLAKKLKSGGALHLATDWEDYAKHMMNVLSNAAEFENTAGIGQYADRSSQRPLVTKFEQRGEHAGRLIWELQFRKY